MFTKYTEVQYDEASFALTLELPYSAYIVEILDKTQEMYDLGKTLSVYATWGSIPHSYRREWIDLAAAEEWELFQEAKANEYGYVLVTFTIGDIVP